MVSGSESFEQLCPQIYRELRLLAAWHLRRERSNHTLQPTALVNETCLRLMQQREFQARDRGHLLALAAQMMRRVLVDHARKRQAGKRGSGFELVALEAVDQVPGTVVDLLELESALARFEALDPQACRVVELRFFAGMSLPETAEALGISESTAKRDWNAAKLWLFAALRGNL